MGSDQAFKPLSFQYSVGKDLGCLLLAPSTFIKDLSSAFPKSTSTPSPIAEYVISQACHDEEAWTLGFLTMVASVAPQGRSVIVGGLAYRTCTHNTGNPSIFPFLAYSCFVSFASLWAFVGAAQRNQASKHPSL